MEALPFPWRQMSPGGPLLSEINDLRNQKRAEIEQFGKLGLSSAGDKADNTLRYPESVIHSPLFCPIS